MPSVYKRKLKSGEYWFGAVKTKDGKWKKFSTGLKTTECSKRNAIEIVQGMQSELKAGRNPLRPEGHDSNTVQTNAQRYLDTRSHELLKPRVLWLHKNTLSLFLDNYSDRPIRSISLADLIDFRNWLIQRGSTRRGSREELSPTTVNNHMMRVGTFLGWCGSILDWTPPRLKKLKVQRTKPIRYYSTEECSRLLAGASAATYNGEPLSWFLGFLLYTGMRKSEALACEWSWIDYTANRIFVPAMKSAKTRAVPIAPVLRALLDEIPQTRVRLFGNISNLHRGSGHLDDVYKRVQADAQLDALTFHDLRRTFIIHCLVSGIPLEMVMDWVGHQSDKTTLEYYTSFAREDQSKMLARVEFGHGVERLPV
ncbi:site-specific integrase [candidate division KSB1 bacterium]|nr:site-specific integrase [candidate division KSB1 bacterium]